jgi:hypothetical protein
MALTTMPSEEPTQPTLSRRPSSLALAGLASIAAGIIHATAAGAHSEHRQTVIAFAATATFQVGWGVWALLRSGRLLALLGAAGNAAAVGGWVLAKTNGISFIDGLEDKEGAQFADTLCAALAGVAALAALATALGLFGLARRAPRPSFVGLAAVAAVAISVPGMVATGSHSHAEGEGEGHGHGAAEEAADGHGHADGAEHASTVPPKPFDPNLPIDLGGVEGVTPEQQTRRRPRPPATARSATRSPVTSTTSSGTPSTTSTRSTPTTPSRSCTTSSATTTARGQRRWKRPCTCCPPAPRSTPCPTSAAR